MLQHKCTNVATTLKVFVSERSFFDIDPQTWLFSRLSLGFFVLNSRVRYHHTSIAIEIPCLLMTERFSVCSVAYKNNYPYFIRLVNFAKQKENHVNTISNKTFSATPDTIEKKWVLIDAEDQPLGRLSSQVAAILRGKNKPEFTPHMDVGDNVVVINAEKVALSGKKMTNKEYFRHTGYPGGEIFTSAADMMEKDPTSLVQMAVKGMLPKNKLGRKLMKNIRIFAGPVHNLTAQKPEKIEID